MTTLKWCFYPSMIYCLHGVYWVHIWPDMVHISKTQDMHEKCLYSRENQNSDIWGFWSFYLKWHIRTPYMSTLKSCLYPCTIYWLHDILGSYMIRYGISIKLRICIRNVLFHDVSVSVKYLTQNMPDGKVCSKYILYEVLWWYMLQILPLFYSK